MSATVQAVRELAVLEPGSPVLSVCLRTDPRDPANTARTPAWLIGMRNGLRDVARRLEHGGPRDDLLAMRELSGRIEAAVLNLEPAQRARGLCWFVTPDGALDRRLTLQLPPRDDVVRWDVRPFVAPLVDVADRGRPTGLVLVSGEAVRLLHWEAGRIEEPEQSVYELEFGEDWRERTGYAVRHPRRRDDAYEGRVDVWRQRNLREAAIATGAKLAELGWDRLLLAGERSLTSRFTEELPRAVTERFAAEVQANLLWEEPGAIADRFAVPLDDAWRREAGALAARALGAARAGGAGVAGWADVLEALLNDRVEHLVFSADEAFAGDGAPGQDHLPPAVTEALGRPSGGMLVERAVERAVASGAGVTALPGQGDGALAAAGGIAATLRF